MFDISSILKEYGQKAVTDIGDNIIRNKQNASGDTINSLKFTATESTLSVFGKESILNLESGVSPSDANKLNWGGTYNNILNWSLSKGLSFANDGARNTFAANTTDKIRREGSLLFGFGGRKDVFSNVETDIINRLSEDIGKEIINMKILSDENK